MVCPCVYVCLRVCPVPLCHRRGPCPLGPVYPSPALTGVVGRLEVKTWGQGVAETQQGISDDNPALI